MSFNHVSSRPLIGMPCPGGLEHAGGIGRAMAYLCAEWATDPSAPQIEVLDTRGAGHLIFAPFHFAHALARILRLGLSGRLTLLHVNIASRGSALRKFFVVVLCAFIRLPFVMHLHGAKFDSFFAGLPRPGKSLVRWMFGRAARVIVLGEVWRAFVIGQLGVSPGRIDIICNGVPAPADERKPHDGPVHIVFLGRLGDRKGVPELMAALASKPLAELQWRATLAGDGEIERFRAEAAERGLVARLSFPGWIGQREAASLLASGDIFVLPSHHEGLPVAVLEAMASGLPVIATPVGSLAEFLTGEDSVLFVTPGDVTALTAALRRLISSAPDRQALGSRAQAVFRQHFDISATAGAVRRSYEAATRPRSAALAPGALVSSLDR